MEDTLKKYELMSTEFVEERFLLRTPYPTAVIILLYLFMVFVYIPNYMRDKKPFVLKKVILAYNVLQIFMNFYILYKGIPQALGIQISCPLANEKLLNLGYTYYCVKVTDLIETGFFALKKKNNQISFLHVYHHMVILSLSYFGCVNFLASGQSISFVIINCSVHLIMYIYYFLSAYNPNSKFITLKKIVTQVQLLQFVILMLQSMVPLYVEHCYMTETLVLLGYSQSVTMIYLFELINKEFADEFFFLRTPYPTAVIILLYLFMVFVYIPNYMRDKKPFVLKKVILAYNVLQIFMNCYILCSIIPETFAQKIKFSCPLASDKMLRSAGYTYYCVKVIDLIETGFFALKKKNNQISFLHVYHHMVILSLSYIGCVNFMASGQSISFVTINCSVHLIMYIYYFLSAYNPNSKFITLKKIVTQVQLLQFVILMLQSMVPLYVEHCYMPLKLVLLGYSQSVTMIYLFGKFYIDTYLIEKI